MSTSQPTSFLRNALLIDAVASGGTGLLMIAGAGFLDGLLGLPAALLRGAGLVLVPYVAFVVWTGTRARIPTAGVWTIIVANAAWAIASAFLLMGTLSPTLLGYVFVIGQALVVALLGEVQYVGLKRQAAAIA